MIATDGTRTGRGADSLGRPCAARYTDRLSRHIWLHGGAGSSAGAVGRGSVPVREAADPTTQTRRGRVSAYAEPSTRRWAASQ